MVPMPAADRDPGCPVARQVEYVTQRMAVPQRDGDHHCRALEQVEVVPKSLSGREE